MSYMRKKGATDTLKVLKKNTHRIYGIFDIKKKKLVAVDLDLSLLEIQYDIGIEDKTRYQLITMEITLF